MLWREPTNHATDCYFCLTKTSGFNNKNKKHIQYPDIASVTKPVLHSEGVPYPSLPSTSSKENEPELMETEMDGTISSQDINLDDLHEFEFKDSEPHLISQSELNDLIRDLQLSKSKSELLASRLQQWNLLASDTRVTFYRSRGDQFTKYFESKDGYQYCHDIRGLFKSMCQSYDAEEWRLFIDSSKVSLKAVLLHNGNNKPSIPIGHAVNSKESYETMTTLIKLIKYEEHNWKVCGDLKVVGLLLGLQSGYTKYCCFLCLWDSRARKDHYIKKDWPVRTEYIPNKMNVKNNPLIDQKNVILPPLHIKLGLMKNFVKALDKDGPAFKYLKTIFPNLSDAKIKEGIFVGPQIRKILKNETFDGHLSSVERDAWYSFKAVVENFLGNNKSEDFKEIVSNLLRNYHRMGVNMSLKIHFLHSHLDFFPDNLGSVSDEHGERFHQDLKTYEERYQGFCDENMLADYCWSVLRETDANQYKRRSNLCHF